MKQIALVAILLTILLYGYSNAQITQVRTALRQVAAGKISEAKTDLAKLKEQYPDDAGVIFLEATLTENAKKALPLYLKIVESYPKHEYADDAYCRIVQYYAIAKDTARARKELEKYRSKYPTSEFLLLASDVVKSTVGLKKTPAAKPASSDKTIVAKTKASEKTSIAKATTPPVEAVTASKAQSSGAKHWGLQVGIYASKESAEKEKERFLKLKLKTSIEKKPMNGGTGFAVVIGNYSSEDNAKKAREEVKRKCNCDPIIYVK